MADSNSIYRRILQISVCALCCEQGYAAASKLALETLTEMLQSYLSELGRTSKANCEHSARAKPTLSDVKIALIDMGADLDSLASYARRPHQLHVNNPMKNRVTPTPKALEAGSKQPRPSYVPSHLPPLPDPHSYIKTPALRQSSEEYQAVREKYAAQRQNIEEGLAKFLAKTAQSKVAICEGLDDLLFPLLPSSPPPFPYLPALIECDELQLDECLTSSTPNNSVDTDKNSADTTAENPFTKPAKRSRKSYKSI